MVKRFFSSSPIPIPAGTSQAMFISQLTGEMLRCLKATLKRGGPQGAYTELEEMMLDWIDPFRVKPLRARTVRGSSTNTALQELEETLTKDSVSIVNAPPTSIPSEQTSPSASADLTTDISRLPCKFHLLGACSSGSSCPFSHEIASTGRIICKYFLEVCTQQGAVDDIC